MGLTWVQGSLAVLCLLTALVLVVHLVRDTVPARLVTGLLALLEVGLLVHAAVGISRLWRLDHEGVSVFSWIGYLVALPVLLPLAWLWSRGDRSRGGTAVLLGAAFVIPFLFVRVHDIWAGA